MGFIPTDSARFVPLVSFTTKTPPPTHGRRMKDEHGNDLHIQHFSTLHSL